MRKIICVVRDDVAEYIVVNDDTIRTVATVSLHAVWDYDTMYLVKLFDGLENLLQETDRPIETQPRNVRFPIVLQDVIDVIGGQPDDDQGMTINDIALSIWRANGGSDETPKWVVDTVRNRIAVRSKSSEPLPWRLVERMPWDAKRAKRYAPAWSEPELPFTEPGQF